MNSKPVLPRHVLYRALEIAGLLLLLYAVLFHWLERWGVLP